ncbi:MAG: hypothetical protein RLY57_295 [Candidatus Parcubacteria bacterium]|jgi:hypothetical protein
MEKFGSLEEELHYLRSKVAEQEYKIEKSGGTPEREVIAHATVDVYQETPATEVLHDQYAMSAQEVGAITLDLLPEQHDSQIAELIHVLHEHGIKNALSVLAGMKNPHLEDDFHRFLVEFIKEGYEVKGLKHGSDLEKVLSKTLYEVALPNINEEGERKSLKELVSVMEQFYAGMLSVGGKHTDAFSLELANSHGSEEFVFYAAVPDERRGLFEKQVVSMFPHAKLTVTKNDYNVFSSEGVAIGATASFAKNPIYPLRTYETFDADPLSVLLNAFSKIDKNDEGAAIQFVIRPATEDYVKTYKKAIDEIHKGKKVKDAIGDTGMSEVIFKEFKDIFFKKEDKKDEPKPIDDIVLEHFKKKIEAQIASINMRIVVSAHNAVRAKDMLHEIQSAFNQFELATGNKISFTLHEGPKAATFFNEYSFRSWSDKEEMPVNFKELASLFHFPQGVVAEAPQLRTSKAVTAPAPLDLPESGIFLGVNKHQNLQKNIYMSPADRLRHFYVIGQTGTGKSTLLRNMIDQDIKNGEGVCFIDPHGSDVQDILSRIPPERYKDVIYFDPSHLDRPLGLNFLEFDTRFPEQKTFVINELMSIFKKLYGATPESMGPAFEQYFRNSAGLVMEHPESGNTLIDIARVLSDKSYRQFKLSMCKNPLIAQFWTNAEKTTGDQGLANYVQYITNKFDVFLSNDYMRPVIAQENSTLNFREIMDQKKILLVNLAKGRLGDINSNLIGLILIGKFTMAALSRVDSFGKADLPPFYLYIDEFQNFTTDSISTILAEARKYKLSLHMAHQYIAQLDEGIKNAVFGNVGNLAIFRVGVDDAEFLEKQLAPSFAAKDIMNIENLNCYMKILSNGKPTAPFNVEEQFPPAGNRDIIDKLKELSYLTYGRDRAEVEAEIMKKYQKPDISPKPVI